MRIANPSQLTDPEIKKGIKVTDQYGRTGKLIIVPLIDAYQIEWDPSESHKSLERLVQENPGCEWASESEPEDYRKKYEDLKEVVDAVADNPSASFFINGKMYKLSPVTDR